jgi:hypothetical protein
MVNPCLARMVSHFQPIFQSDLLALSVKRGLINSQDHGRFGQVAGSLQDFAKVRFLQFLHGNQRTDLR